jgi:NAD(P)H-hydrate epimerase
MPSAFVDGNNSSFMNSTLADPILTCADAKALETRLFGGDEELEWAAMQCAGASVARAVLTDLEEIGGFPDAGRVLVLAGKGHNGGDALLAAKAILEKHPTAFADVVFALGERDLRPLAARAWRELVQAAPRRVRSLDRVLPAVGAQSSLRPPVPGNAGEGANQVAASVSEWKPSHDICLDGVFGFQFHPPMDAATAAVLGAVNAHPAIRLRAAVDLPSGVSESAKIEPVIFRADFTYATGIVKLAALDPAAAASVGRLRYLDLGFFGHSVGGGACPEPAGGEPVEPVEWVDPGPGSPIPATDFVLKPSILAPLAQLRAPLSDKRTFGHLFVIGGSRSYPGAALMCVRAALRSGVGLVTAFVPESLAAAFAAGAPEAIWVGWPETPQGGLALEGLHLLRERLERATALVMGSGLGAEREGLTLLEEIVKLARTPVVLDADALQPPVLAAAAGRRIVCLPHAGEFKRLAGGREAGADALRAIAREAGATIVLKGPVTRISDGGQIYHSFFGGPVLARGGSGDLLAGLVGGLVAQSRVAERRPVPPGDEGASALLLAACRGVAWHGMAADLLARDRGQVAVQVTQLLDYLPAALRDAAC